MLQFRFGMIVECPGCQSRYDVTGRPPGTRARCRCGAVFALPEPAGEAGQMSCPQCGANVPPGAHSCTFCTAALLVKACPRCFARMFHGAKHCNQCGAKVDVPAAANADGTARKLACPRCETDPELVARLVGDVLLDECTACHGVWLDAAQVERLIQDRRQASTEAVLGMAEGPRPVGELGAVPQGRMYLKCPDCETVMNRVNFAKRSGIIIDVCRSHGTWFDESELPKVVDFVRQGGVEQATRIEAERMREEARRDRSAAQFERARAQHSGQFHTRTRNVDSFAGLLGSIGAFLID